MPRAKGSKLTEEHKNKISDVLSNSDKIKHTRQHAKNYDMLSHNQKRERDKEKDYIKRDKKVTKEELEKWQAEYKDDVSKGYLKFARGTKTRIINCYLFSIELQRKNRICLDYKQLDEFRCEGTLRDGRKIIAERSPEHLHTHHHTMKLYRIYIDNKLVYKGGTQVDVVNWLKKYFKDS